MDERIDEYIKEEYAEKISYEDIIRNEIVKFQRSMLAFSLGIPDAKKIAKSSLDNIIRGLAPYVNLDEFHKRLHTIRRRSQSLYQSLSDQFTLCLMHYNKLGVLLSPVITCDYAGEMWEEIIIEEEARNNVKRRRTEKAIARHS